jgi:hypothetical protein
MRNRRLCALSTALFLTVLTPKALAQETHSAAVDRVEQLEPQQDQSIEKDIELLALTMWAEARGEGKQGMYNVGSVIINRLHNGFRNGIAYDSINAVVKAPGQFSVWRKNTKPYHRMMRVPTMPRESGEYKAYVTAKEIARDLIDNGPRHTATSFTAKIKKSYVGGKVVYVSYNFFYK